MPRRFETNVRRHLAANASPGFCSTLSSSFGDVAAGGFSRLKLTVSDLEPFNSVAQLRAGHDVAVVDDLLDIREKGLVKTTLAGDEIIMCFPRNQQAPEKVSLSANADKRWMGRVGSVFEQSVRQTGRNVMASLGLLSGGAGIALMSGLNLGRETEDLLVRSVEPSCDRNIVVLYRTDPKMVGGRRRPDW